MTGESYSSVNSARSPFSSIIKPAYNVLFGKSPLVYRLLNSFFNIRPALPRYVNTWDVTIDFNFIKSKPTLTDYDLKTLSHRLATLKCFTAGQRNQTLSA